MSCTMSVLVTVSTTFTKNVVAYDTTNILSFSQEIIGAVGAPDYTGTTQAFNNRYGSYLYDNYGILVYHTDTDKINIHSTYSLNDFSYDKYFIPNVYLNNISITGTTGITNSEIDRVVLEFDDQLVFENVLPNEPENFNTNFNTEIYFDLSTNEKSFGFNLELNDVDYYVDFTGNTQTTINSFISGYTSLFNNMGLNLSSGTTTTGETAETGYTLLIDAIYPNVDVRSYSVRVNLFSSYEIVSETESQSLLLSGNELELSPTLSSSTLYDYGFATGMVFTLSGSSYSYNNKSYNIIGLTPTIIELSYQGLFFEESEQSLTLKVDRFLRKPRESANKDIYYNWRFETPFSEDIFFYDFTGEHLEPYLGDSRLTYTGPTPLWDINDPCSEDKISLIDEPNKKINFIDDRTKQQTVFRGKDGSYCLKFLLDEYDSLTEYDYIPEPLQVFLGFNSKIEGVSQTTVYMDKVENITYSGYTNSTLNQNGIEFSFANSGLLYITTTEPNFNFIDKGFEKYQPITIDFVDQSETGTTIFENYGTFLIEYVGGKQMKLTPNVRNFLDEDFGFVDFNTTGNSNGYYFEIKVQPNPILKLSIFGETETEDERFRIVLNNLGIQINEDVEHLFKESDIDEHGIDYIRLNRKRKEMLLQYPEIYNYIGSYKALINAINFFGWNDLELFEYYKNVDPNSPLYQKLHKVLIPDIFDNTVIGWNPTDYVNGKYKTGLIKKTNLFNLTYKITDEDGNNVLIYSLDEAQIKLNKLKRWLKRNILPLSTNIVDITGVADVVSNHYQNFDVSNQSIKPYSSNETTSINFVYTETLNFEDNYLFEIEFYTRNGFIPSGWTCKIQTFSMSTDGTNKLIPQKYFKLMKNDLGNYSFNINKNVDQYLYIETVWFNDFGFGQKYNKMTNTSTSKNYLLVNNRFHIPDYTYLNVDGQYYWFNEEGHIFLED